MSPYEIKANISEHIRRSFRDTADADYIGARAAYKMELFLLFLWLSNQALEKYLKAILVFNNRPANGFKHDVSKIYDDVLTIPDIQFDFPERTAEFIRHLSVFGQDRYFEHNIQISGNALEDLDAAVWTLRRYCQMLRWSEFDKSNGVLTLAERVKEIQSPVYQEHPERFRIRGGLLESIRDKKTHPARAQLLLNNRYFGGRNTVRSVKTVFASPQVVIAPEVLQELEKLIFITKKTKTGIEGQKGRKK